MLYRILLSFLLCLAITACHPHKSVLKEQVQALEHGKRYETAIIGTGFPSTQHRYYGKIREVATQDDLVKLCRHRSPVVNAYAFQALLERDTTIVRKVYDRMKKSHKQMPTMYGCITHDDEPLGDVLEQILFNKYPFDITCISDSVGKKNFDIFYGFVGK